VKRLVIWQGLDGWRAEAASIELTTSGVHATGTQLGSDPVTYRLDYTLDAAQNFVTRSLSVEVTGEGWSRSVRLAHDGAGGWHCESEQSGGVDLPAPGGVGKALAGAKDCDLGFSPLTNLMPIRRHSLDARPGSADLLMAWVSVPDLGVVAYPQRYEHIGVGQMGAVVRFTSLGIHDGFTSDLELDRDGLVLVYPQLARRVEV
jgi:uncharacterized protein